MTLKGLIECNFQAGSNILVPSSNTWVSNNEVFVTLYNFFNNLSAIGVTRIAYNVGSSGAGMGYWDTGLHPGNGAWALFRFGNAQIPFYVLLQGANLRQVSGFLYSSYAGSTPTLTEMNNASNNSDTGSSVLAGISIAMRLDGSSPWNGTTVNTGTDTKGTPVWTPGGSTLAVWPRGNSLFGTTATNREMITPIARSNANALFFDPYLNCSRMSCIADENNVLIITETRGSGIGYTPFFFGRYNTRPGLTAQIPYVLLAAGVSSDPPFQRSINFGAITYSAISSTYHAYGGICHPNATLGVKSCWVDYPSSQLTQNYHPSRASTVPGRFELYPYAVIINEHPWSGVIGHVDFIRWSYNIPMFATSQNKNWAVIGGLCGTNTTKLVAPWDGQTIPGSGINRTGISF